MDYKEMSKIFNDAVYKAGIEPDRYAREDAFFGFMDNLEKGMSTESALDDVFSVCFGIERSWLYE